MPYEEHAVTLNDQLVYLFYVPSAHIRVFIRKLESNTTIPIIRNITLLLTVA